MLPQNIQQGIDICYTSQHPFDKCMSPPEAVAIATALFCVISFCPRQQPLLELDRLAAEQGLTAADEACQLTLEAGTYTPGKFPHLAGCKILSLSGLPVKQVCMRLPNNASDVIS